MPQEFVQINRYAIAPGVELMVDPMPQASGVALGLWFAAGSAYEREHERGLSHFVEHMVFKGAGGRDVEELSRAIDRVGGYLNAFTERETVCVHCLIPAEHALLALEILLDMIFRPRFLKPEFEREKDVIVNEIMAAEDDLEEAAQDEFFAMVYQGHPASRRIAGKVEDLREATFDGLLAFHDERFARGTIVISVAGAVEPDLIAQALRAAVPARNGARAMAWDPGAPAFRKSRRMVKAAGSQVYVLTGLPIDTGSSEDDFWRLSAASSAYGESMSSRLFMRLREEHGLCYGISSSLSLSRMAGLWGVASSTTPAQLPRFAEAYLREARALHEHGLTDIEVGEAVSRIRGLLELASDDPEYRMKRIARQFMFEGRTEPVSVTMDRLSVEDALSPHAVDNLIRQALDPAEESVLLYGKLGQRTVRAGASLFGAVLEEALDGPQAKDA
ncbi:MAG TPA: pitrilysin family protein [bacterium]|nr:pitrilysin family protein [bacterium]